MKSSTFFMAGL